MARRQETLIYIEKENTAEAEFMSRNFVKPEIKNKAYINALGAELVMKYLSSEGIDVSNLHNIHSISKILEKYDIADILLPNIHIDVRVIFDEDEIFIPKSHFELEITPDIYVVLKLDKNFKHTEFLGYFKTTKINKKNENDNYYFVSKDKLSNPDSLAKFIKNYTGKTSRSISEEDMYRGRELSVSLADHNITHAEEKELLELLLLNDSLRESVLEFDNFETLSYSAAPELSSNTLPEFTFISDENNTDEESKNETNEINNEELDIDSNEELTFDEGFLNDLESLDETPAEEPENTTENEIEETNTESDADEEDDEEKETILDSDEILDSTELDLNDLTMEEAPVFETEINETETAETNTEESLAITTSEEETENESIITNDVDLGDDLLGEGLLTDEITLPEIETHENVVEDTIDTPVTGNIEETPFNEPSLMPTEELSVDAILDSTIASIDTPKNNEEKEEPKKDINKDLAEILGNVVQETLEKTAAAGAIAATGAVVAEASTAGAAAAASEEVIKLASVAGDIVDNIVGENLEKQQKNLDRIDYEKTDIAPDTVEIPENVIQLGEDLSVAKMEANLEAEFSGQFDSPTDLSALDTVETYEEEAFEHETININDMDSVQTEEFIENTDEIVNLENLTEIDSPTKPSENLPEITAEEDFTGMDLPDLSSYTINEDGTSPLDNLDAGFELEAKNDEHLVDMDMNINEISLDDNFADSLDFNTEDLKTEDLTSFEDNSSFEPTIEQPSSEIESELFNQEDEQLNVQEESLTDNDFENNIFDEFNTEEFSNENSNELEVSQEPELFEETLFEDEKPEIQNFEQNEIFDKDTENVGNTSDIEVLEDGIPISDAEVDALELESAFESESNIQPEVDFNLETDIPEQSEEPVQETQDWMNDTDYENLQDVEIEAPTPIDEIITEPEPIQKEYKAMENSTVISDRTFTPGEIPIDINNTEDTKFEGSETLENLYDPNSKVPGGALLQNPGRMGTGNLQGKSGLGLGLGIAGTLVTLALVGAIGFGVAKMFKTPTEEAPQPITDEPLPTSSDNGVTETNTLNVNPENVVNMENNTNTLATTTPAATQKQPQTVTQAPVQTSVPAAKTPAQSFIDIKKLTWEVPDYISYNPQFKQYFQSVGKSLKLTLTSDLLLAKDNLYSNQVRVSVTFDKEGIFKTSQIIVSSGSQEIDKIVLQTVNQTLKALKAPHSVGNDESTTAILKIYF